MILTVGEVRYKHGKGRILWHRIGIADANMNSLFLISIHTYVFLSFIHSKGLIAVDIS